MFLRAEAGARRVETRDPAREFKASRRTKRDGMEGGRVPVAVKLKAGRDRDRNGRGRPRIFFIYAREDTKTSKVSGGEGREARTLRSPLRSASISDIMRIASERSVALTRI